MLPISLLHALSNLTRIVFAVFRLMTPFVELGIVMEIVYKPEHGIRFIPWDMQQNS